jgi:broad specificity phosphatase PhoE
MARLGGFADAAEPLDAGGLRSARTVRIPGPAPRHVATSPALAACQTAEALGLAAETVPALRDIGPGIWAGKHLADLHAADPDALAGWMADPASGAPGGETMAAVQDRVAEWLAAQTALDISILAITHPMVIRAAIAAALALPVTATLRIDVAPLSAVVLSYNRGWRLQALGHAGHASDAAA